MTVKRRSVSLAILLFALGLPCWAEGISISVGAGGGIGFGFSGEFLQFQSNQLAMGGLRFAGSYGLVLGPGTLEMGAATGFSATETGTLMPLALTVGYSVPIAEHFAITAGIRGGMALMVANGESFQFEPFVGPQLELFTIDWRQTWGFYLGFGADFILEKLGVGATFMAGFGFRYFIK